MADGSTPVRPLTAPSPPLADPPTLDLSNCENEPIHIPGVVQSHGVLVALDAAGVVVVASANADALLGTPAEELLGQRYGDVLPAPAAATVPAVLAAGPPDHEQPPQLLFAGQLAPSLEGELLAHWSGDALLLEFCPFSAPTRRGDVAITEQVRTIKAELRAPEDALGYCRKLASCLRELSGYDRVMIYRFAPDWHGEVYAEAKLETLEPFLGLHYPASDIPRRARDLFRRNPSRLIEHIGDTPAPLIPDRLPDGSPLDLSLSYLRGVSPIHLEYLANMGVTATLAIALHCGEALWGLVACHHYAGPKRLSHAERLAMELVCATAESRINELNSVDERQRIVRSEECAAKILTAISRAEELIDALNACTADMVSSTGFVGTDGEHIVREGATPSDALVRKVVEFLETDVAVADDFCTDHLGRYVPEAEAEADTAAGLLAVRLSPDRDSWMLWFRDEQVTHVHWAGNPHKPAKVGPHGLRLHPRGSFALWKQEVRGKSIPWGAHDVNLAKRLRSAILEVLFRERTKLKALTAELDRANQSLAAFASMASHDLRSPLRGINNLANFVEEDCQGLNDSARGHISDIRRLTGRMQSMIKGLLDFAQVGGEDVEFEAVELDELFDDMRLDLRSRIKRSGAEVTLAPGLPTVTSWRMGLERVFANLLDNALKYGGEHPPGSSRESPPRRWTEVLVRDHGGGVDPADREQILKDYSRLNPVAEGPGAPGSRS
ncbi:MAG: GAF domain-containing protein [Planctomycetota bacterium]